jgi:hypothetical protein
LKFAAPAIPTLGPYLGELSELPPAFAISFMLGVLLSITDSAGKERMQGVSEELTSGE